MDLLIRDAKFWAAIVLLVKAILFYAVPSFPAPVWAAIDGIVAVLLGGLAGVEARQQVVARRIERGLRGLPGRVPAIWFKATDEHGQAGAGGAEHRPGGVFAVGGGEYVGVVGGGHRSASSQRVRAAVVRVRE